MDNARRACERPFVRHAAALLILSLLSASSVRAEPPAQELFARAEKDDADGAYAKALAEYEEATAVAPSAPFVPRAQARAAILRAHAEGDFVPLARLERVRRDPKLSSDPREIDALARDAETFPPGLVRAEARLLVAEAYLGRLGRPAEAPPILERVADDPSTDPLTARLAVRMLVDLRIAQGDTDGAIAAARARPALVEANLMRQVTALARRRVAHRVAIGVLVAAAALLAAAALRARRRRELAPALLALRKAWRPALVLAAIVAGGGLLASTYESGTSAPFLLLGAVVLPLTLAARAWGAIGSAGAAARAGRAALCAATVLAAALLVLEWVEPRYLGSFGL
jgi:hypothetical protein